jgi:DNA-binding LacI/PurR family transcriptional regulator
VPRRTGIDRPTIIDVADMAGVSRQTVSRVMADHPRVAGATRTRVKEAIETLGYRPNRMARALVTQSSLTFGFAAVDMRDLHFGDTCSGMQVAAREHGYHLVVTELDFDDDGALEHSRRFSPLVLTVSRCSHRSSMTVKSNRSPQRAIDPLS